MSNDKVDVKDNSIPIKKGRATLKDSLIRLKKISELVDEGLTTEQICEELDLSVHIVNKHRHYLKDLQIADLTKEDIAKKRSQLYQEMEDVEIEVKDSIEKLKGETKVKYATVKTYLDLWKGIIESKAKMFGVLEVKTDGLTFNQQINAPIVKDRLNQATREKLSKLIIEQHESNV